MKTKIRKLMTLALMPAGMLALTSCSSTPKEESSKGQPSTEVMESRGGTTEQTYRTSTGRTEVGTYRTTATITAIDPATRNITLTAPDGKQTTIKAGPEVRNFDQLHVGDQVNTTYTQSLAVSLRPAGTPPSGSESSTVEVAPKGAKPGGMMSDTTEITARIMAIDPQQRTVNLQFADGTTREVKVRPDVDLNSVKPGDSVTMRVTQSMAIQVEKP